MEALHEDLYFGLLEFMQGLHGGDALLGKPKSFLVLVNGHLQADLLPEGQGALLFQPGQFFRFDECIVYDFREDRS